MVEEEQSDIDLIRRALQKADFSFETRVVDSEDKFLSALTEFCPDVILSDHSLPQFNSIEALRICQNQGLKIPFILVSGTVSDEFATISIKAGVTDYVVKSDLKRLPSVISKSLRESESGNNHP